MKTRKGETGTDCKKCGASFELIAWADGEDFIGTDVVEFAAVCPFCKGHVYSKGYVCGETCKDLESYNNG